jgi:prepilin-type N-terminal cleavage/methylation domain-containing protein
MYAIENNIMSKVLKQKALLVSGNMSSRNRQSGFTLIEIAIVLVIIGLLLGGVLKGQELINTARVRALNNSVDGVTAAWFSFQDRYRAFPGDYAQASVNLPGIVAAGDGDGNGLVGSTAAEAAERPNVWTHLAAAGYITGSFDAAAVAVDAYNCDVTTCPDNGFGSGMNLAYGISVKGAAGAPAHELITGRGIPVEVIAELDRKVDDGVPRTGAMRLGLDGTGWGVSAACERDETANAAIGAFVYEIKAPSSDCAAVFRNF